LLMRVSACMDKLKNHVIACPHNVFIFFGCALLVCHVHFCSYFVVFGKLLFYMFAFLVRFVVENEYGGDTFDN